MSTKMFWQRKLVQLLHDPPGKAFFLRAGTGGHKTVAAELFESLAGRPLKFVPPQADWAAAGADRPVISPPARTAGVRPIVVDWVVHPVITHPLASGEHGRTDIDFGRTSRPRSRDEARTLAAESGDTLNAVLQRYGGSSTDEHEDASLSETEQEQRLREVQAQISKLHVWDDERKLQEACLQLWRIWPETRPDSLESVLWECQPADSRTPDHSLWDHLRVASALAFLTGRKDEAAAMPWLLAFSIGPVQRFIAQSRTSSDLWTTSMLLSDLIWHAMLPFVNRYGPESIVYPDLRGNPRADQWLFMQQLEGRWRNVLPERSRSGGPMNPCSYAGIFPNTFIALVPRGGDGDCDPLEKVADEAKRAVHDRWKALADCAYTYFINQDAQLRRPMSEAERSAFDAVWKRQHERVLFAVWSAVAWPDIERMDRIDEWRARHAAWIPGEAIARYTAARTVYAQTNVGVHQSQRGFDYPLVHHALHVRHAHRKAQAHGAPLENEAGEKCTLCGERQALGLAEGAADEHIDVQREKVRAFWSAHSRTSDGGAERLCAVCSMKRVLIRAGIAEGNRACEMPGLTAAWAGPATPVAEILDGGELRVPFPSTVTMAAQGYLCAVATHPGLRAEVSAVVACAEAVQLPRTTFVRSLRSLAAAGASGTDRRFLEYDAQIIVSPDEIASAVRRLEAGADDGDLRDRTGKLMDVARLRALGAAVQALREGAARLNASARKAGKRPPIPPAGTQVALIAIDGDGIRRLLLGKRVGARWRDVIHPAAVTAMEQNSVTVDAGWPRHLDEQRLMGPSAHAFINRVLAEFAHTIVPWVVEREFSGRLVYAGGDDVLALAPASEALDICARLAQLYSAPWIVDTEPEEEPWSWRRKHEHQPPGQAESSPKAAAERFIAIDPGEKAIPWPVPGERALGSVAAWTRDAKRRATGEVVGRLLPMMGMGQSLSAGIAVGHYKTPLGALVQTAWDERDRAKGKEEEARGVEPLTKGSAFSIRRFSRSGAKASLRMAWGGSDPDGLEAFGGYLDVKHTIDAFRTGALAGRLPYKLRELEDLVLAVWRQEAEKGPRAEALARTREIAEGLMSVTCEGAPDAAKHAAFAIWWTGLQGLFRADRATRDDDAVAGAEQGLAVCRFLGTLGSEEEDR